MNWTIPAMLNRIDGSLLMTDADGTTVWPFSSKNVSQRFLISAVLIRVASFCTSARRWSTNRLTA